MCTTGNQMCVDGNGEGVSLELGNCLVWEIELDFALECEISTGIVHSAETLGRDRNIDRSLAQE
jgi:hypothetical protein